MPLAPTNVVVPHAGSSRPTTTSHGIPTIVIAIMVAVATSCSGPDVAGQYALVEVRSRSEFFRAGEQGMYGTLRLEPGGKLSGQFNSPGFSGDDKREWNGSWIAKDGSVQLFINEDSSSATLSRSGILRMVSESGGLIMIWKRVKP